MRYMPLLRLQQSEYLSLGELTDDVADEMTPLMYQTPALDDDPLGTAQRRLDRFNSRWARPAFFDPELAVRVDGVDGETLYDMAAEMGYTPTVSLDLAVVTTASAAAGATGGAAIRITDPYIVLDPDLTQNIDRALDGLGLAPSDVVLIFDLGASDDPRACSAVLRFPYLDDWRDVVLAAGVFAPVLVADSRTRIPRAHLGNWRSVNDRARRQITFGDYGVLEATYQEPVSFPPAAKLTYTEPEAWFYARGRSIVTDGNEQIYGLANEIVSRPTWRGADYSWGDDWIADRAQSIPSPGNAGTWIKVGMTHHITHVVREDV